MTGPTGRRERAAKPAPVRRLAALVLGLLGALALAGCASFADCRRRKRTTRSRPRNRTWRRSPRSIQKHPDDPQAYNMRGSVLAEAGHTEEALADFNKAISLDPNYAQAYANRALLYRQTGKLDLALADYNKALSIDGNYAPAYLGRGIVYRAARPQRAGARRLQQGDRAQARQRAGLLQSRPALSEPASAPIRHRRFLHVAWAHPAQGRAVRGAGAELSGDRRRQIGGERSRRGGADRSRRTCRRGPAAASPTSVSDRRTRPPAPTPRRSTSTTNTSRRAPASPASAARSGSPTRRSERPRASEAAHDDYAQSHHRSGARQGRIGEVLRRHLRSQARARRLLRAGARSTSR